MNHTPARCRQALWIVALMLLAGMTGHTPLTNPAQGEVLMNEAVHEARGELAPTLDNLNKALRGETNASHRYELFAQKAEQEGFHQVSKLFWSISMSESIHRNNHKAAILALGGTPMVVDFEPVEVRSTRENLQVPLVGEKYESDTMYPEFIRQAQNDHIPLAVQSFSYAMHAEVQHDKLFQDALDHLGHNPPVEYCVERVSGSTSAITGTQTCPISSDTLSESIRIP